MGAADLLAVGIILVPVVYVALIAAGKLGVGPLTSYTSRTSSRPASVPDTVSIREGETVEYQIDPRRSRWKRLALLAVFLLPFGWGVAVLIYALRVRDRARYVITDRRVVEETRDEVTSYEYDRISQVQTGASVPESIVGRGHVRFSIDNRTLVTVGWLRDPEALRTALRDHASA